MLTAYKEQKRRLLEQYNKILACEKLLPLDKIDKNFIQEKIENLENEHFLVSFTGQIKAGKSTLINALLFGKEVIPSEDTPYTAKITLIKYSPEVYLEATFYSKEEWSKLLDNEEFYKEYLKPDIEAVMKKGIYPQAYIHEEAMIKKEFNLDNLKEFVTKEGKYTPFVNYVTLYSDNEILKEISFVDTPGINDANKQRDGVVKDWIHKTNANIYVSYAGQAMSAEDIEFIDTFLLTVPKEQKITVINKIDTISEWDGLNEWLEELIADEILEKREIFGDKDSIVSLSALGALIDKMDKAGLDLGALEYYADILDEKGFLEPDKHCLSKLENTIERKLIKTKGQNIILFHQRMIDSIFAKKTFLLKQQIQSRESELLYLIQNRGELKETSKNIEETLFHLNNEMLKIKERFLMKRKEKLEVFRSKITNLNTISKEYVSRELTKVKHSKSFKNEFLWIVKKALDSNYDILKFHIINIRKALTSFAEQEIHNLKSKLKVNENIVDIHFGPNTHIFDFYANDLMDKMKDLANKSFKEETVAQIIQDNQSWYQVFETESKKNQIISVLLAWMDSYLENVARETQKILEEEIDTHIKEEILVNLPLAIKEVLKKKEQKVNKFMQDMAQRNILISEAQEDKNFLEKELSEIEAIVIE